MSIALQAGKFFKTTDGRRVRILCIDAPGFRPAIGYVDDGSNTLMRWNSAGQVNANGTPDPGDIAAIWPAAAVTLTVDLVLCQYTTDSTKPPFAIIKRPGEALAFHGVAELGRQTVTLTQTN